MTSARLRDVLTAMAADDAVVDEIVRALGTTSLPAAEHRRHVRILLAAGLNGFARTAHPDEAFAEAAALGAERAAQGVPMADLLRGVQAARSHALRLAIARARDAGIPDDELLSAWLDVDRYTSALERHIIGGYKDVGHQPSEGSLALLRRLLLGGDPLSDQDLRASGLRPRSRYRVVVSEHSLARIGGIAAPLDGRFVGVVARLPSVADPAGADPVDPPGAALIVASPAVAVPALAAVYPACVAALTVAAARGLRGVRELTDLAAETALAGHPMLAGLLCARLCGALDPQDEFHLELATTALAFLDHRRLGPTAAALHLHANTVRYRLDRLAELTGTAWDSPCAVPELVHRWWALRTWLGGSKVS
jgi:hypothetical protein